MNISGWVTFKEIVDSVLLAGGDSSDHGQFMRYLNFAIKGYEELRLRHLPATRPVTLPINPDLRIVVLPMDFLKFVSVGVMSGGSFYPFFPKSEIVPATTADCGVDTRVIPSQSGVTTFAAYYTLDLENRRIVIDAPLALQQVTLNYTPTGVKTDGKTYIPRMARMVVETYIEYQAALRDKGVNANDKMIFQNEYLKAIMNFRGLMYDPDEIFGEYYKHLVTGKQY